MYKNTLYSVLLVLLLSLGTNSIYSQNIDSISQRVNALPGNEQKVFAWINAANQISESAPKQAFDYIEEALVLSLSLENIRGEAYCYNTMGGLNYGLQRFKKAVKYYEKAKILFEGLTQETGYYNTLKYLPSSLEGEEEHQKALEAYRTFQTIAEERKNKDDIVFAYNGIARCNKALNRLDITENYYQKAYGYEQQRDNDIGVINAASNLSQTYEVMNDTIMALNYNDTVLSISNSINYEPGINKFYQNADNYYGNRNMTSQQMDVQKQAILFNGATKNSLELNKANLEVGKLNVKTHNPQRAIPYLKETINLSDEIGELQVKEEALEAITEAYAEIGDYKSALTSFQELSQVRDSLQEEKNKQALLANTLTIALEDKEKQIELLSQNAALNKEKMALAVIRQEEKQQSQRYIIYSLIGGILILLISSILVLKSNRDRSKANMLLELKSLRTQMNPHFIFNSLNSVNSFISKNDDRSANKYLSRFSQLMRMVLENSKHDFVDLENEVKILELYMELEHLRFQDKFEYSFEKDSSIDITTMQVPPMLIQPYIENAVWHGLRYKESKGALKVSYTKNKDGNKLRWLIEDNGIGREQSQIIKTENQRQGQSTGMKNIEERLRILNKMNATNMTASVTDLKDENGNSCGTRVEIYTEIKS